MAKSLTLAASAACYFAFFGSFLYLVGFVEGFDLLPTHVDKGLSASAGTAVLINLALIALFGVQHSVMARPAFKARWTRIVPPALERGVYCLASALALVALFAWWHPIAGSLWTVENPNGQFALVALSFMGWGMVFVSTFLLNHFELFGLQQAWHNFRGTRVPPPTFRTPLFYRWVRHPIYTGFLLAFWATPDMTYGHFVLAAGFTVYVLIGISHEERDLLDYFGETYAEYRKNVGSLIPGVGRHR